LAAASAADKPVAASTMHKSFRSVGLPSRRTSSFGATAFKDTFPSSWGKLDHNSQAPGRPVCRPTAHSERSAFGDYAVTRLIWRCAPTILRMLGATLGRAIARSNLRSKTRSIRFGWQSTRSTLLKHVNAPAAFPAALRDPVGRSSQTEDASACRVGDEVDSKTAPSSLPSVP
jgi:hypothetical protein